MIIDLTGIATNSVKEIAIDNDVVIDSDWYLNTSIRNLRDVKFIGKVIRNVDASYHLIGNLKGIMVLPDDVTLEDVDYVFDVDIEEDIPLNGNESIKIIQNRLDITEFLWQNILVEVPLKVKDPKNEGLTIEGNGWRLISEDDKSLESNSPLSELSKIFDSRKE